jgi:mannose-6-phosphate isomerase-like protein (cupin superfamily)
LDVQIRARDRVEAFTTKDGSTIRELLGAGVAAHQSLAEATLAAGQETQRHYHAETEEIYYLVEGGAELEIDGERAEVAPGDAILIPPGARHRIRAGAGGCRFLCCCAPAYRHDDTFFD